MDCRIVNADTLEQVKDLWDYCFEKKDSSFFKWYFQDYCLKQNKIIGGFDKAGKLLTMLHLNPYVMQVRDKAIKTSYIVGVATEPCARGKHLMGDLLKTTFNLLRATGTPFVFLMPINAGIYLPYNFAYTHLRHKYSMPIKELKQEPLFKSLTVERCSLLKAKDTLAKIYSTKMAEYNAFTLRSDANWQNYLTVSSSEGQECVIVSDEDNSEGYAIYSIENRKLIIQEMLTINPLAKQQLIKFFSGFTSEADTIEWLAEENDLTYLDFTEQKYAGQTAPFMMSRIIDVAKAISLVEPKAPVIPHTFTLFIKDDFMELNTILTKCSITQEGITFTESVDKPKVVMDIKAFTQLYFGTYSVEELVQAGKIFSDDDKALASLASVFTKQVNYINEYF